jgi:hypothetical protein
MLAVQLLREAIITMRALILAFALAACGQGAQTPAAAPAPSETPDPFLMNIEIGRYGVMLDQVSALSMQRPDGAEADPTDPIVLARRLREVVWAYNLERSRLCGRALFTNLTCGPAFDPVWINEPRDAAPSLEVLAQRQAAVDALVLPFWSAVCADAKTRRAQDEDGVCPIE